MVTPPSAGNVVLTGRVVAALGRGWSAVAAPPAVETMVTSAGLDVFVPGSLVSMWARKPFSSAS